MYQRSNRNYAADKVQASAQSDNEICLRPDQERSVYLQIISDCSHEKRGGPLAVRKPPRAVASTPECRRRPPAARGPLVVNGLP
jgi:hypothetical protein